MPCGDSKLVRESNNLNKNIMKKNISILALTVSILFLNSCINKDKNDSPEVEKPTSDSIVSAGKTEPLDNEMCYLKTFNKDSTWVSLKIDGNNISGKMLIKPFEKDKSDGSLSGTKAENGELDLLYTYMIEGMNQTETKVMKIENGKLYIKVGELTDAKNDGNLKYKDVMKAEFKDILDKIECK